MPTILLFVGNDAADSGSGFAIDISEILVVEFTDDDNLGIGDIDGLTETGAAPVVTSVNGGTTHPLVGQTLNADAGYSLRDNPLTLDVAFFSIGPARQLSLNVGGTDQFYYGVVEGGANTLVLGRNELFLFLGTVPEVQFVCFTAGTRIGTDRGPVAIEELSERDFVETLDHGLQPILWIGSRYLDSIDLAMNPKLCPVRIKVGALGENTPEQDLTVSPQHRILLRSKIARRMFGQPEILVPAIKLVELDGIDQLTDCTEVTYWHFLLDDHQIVFANGTATESLYTGPEALKAVSPDAREEIKALIPALINPDYKPIPAKPILAKGKRMKKLVARHAKNNKALVEAAHTV